MGNIMHMQSNMTPKLVRLIESKFHISVSVQEKVECVLLSIYSTLGNTLKTCYY
jgi:hypothetical protein